MTLGHRSSGREKGIEHSVNVVTAHGRELRGPCANSVGLRWLAKECRTSSIIGRCGPEFCSKTASATRIGGGGGGREKQEGRRRSRRRPEGEEFFFWGSYDSFVVSEVITDDEYQVVNY